MSAGAELPVPGRGRAAGLRFRLGEAHGVTVLFMAGEVDVTVTEQLGDALATGCSLAGDRLVIDVSGLGFMDLSGVRGVVRAHIWLLGQGGSGVVVRGASGKVRRVFELTGLTSLLGDWPPAAVLGFPPSRAGDSGWELETGRRHAGLSVQELFVAYFALGGTADLSEMAAHLSGAAAVLDVHQRDVAAQALNERLADLGRTEHLLAYAADRVGSGTGFR